MEKNGSKNKRRHEAGEEQKEAKRQRTERSDSSEDTGESQSRIYDDENVNRIKQVRRAKAKEEKYRYFETEDPRMAASLGPSREEGPMEPFSMDSDLKYGRFDETGNFIFNRRPNWNRAADDADLGDNINDPWFESLREASDAILDKELPRQAEAETPSEEDEMSGVTSREIIVELCSYLNSNETPTQALKRLKEKAATVEKTDAEIEKPLKKEAAEGEEEDDRLDKEACRIRARFQRRKLPPMKKMSEADKTVFDRITQLTDRLMLGMSIHNVLSMKQGELLALANRGGDTAEPGSYGEEMVWQFRWRNSADQSVYGPSTSAEILGWIEAGYISDATPVDVREVTASGEPIDGIWRDWKSIRFTGSQYRTAGQKEDEEGDNEP